MLKEHYKVYEEKMKKSVEAVERDFGAVRAGRANASVLNRIQVDYYGTPTPIQQIAAVASPDPRTLLITPWDASALKGIEKAIQESDLGINPQNDGKSIRLAFPQLTEERRKDLVKQIRKYNEGGKVAIRNIRRDALEAFKKMQKASEALGMLKAGKITECEYNSLENTACPGCGSCSFLGTANTMCCVSEALGMTLPGGALIPAAYAGRLRHSFESGRAIVELCKKGITARQILTKEAIRNAIKVTMAICGSTNAVLHLPAIANEAELDMNVLEEFEALTKTTPQIAKVNPAAKPEMEAFYRAGGIPRVMQHLGGLLDTSVMTVSGKTLADTLAVYVYD